MLLLARPVRIGFCGNFAMLVYVRVRRRELGFETVLEWEGVAPAH
jgi:hypothetical protein